MSELRRERMRAASGSPTAMRGNLARRPVVLKGRGRHPTRDDDLALDG